MHVVSSQFSLLKEPPVESVRAHLVEEVVFVDVAAVRQDAEVAARAVDEDRLEFAGLVVGALVRVEAQVPKPLEVRLSCLCVRFWLCNQVGRWVSEWHPPAVAL